MSICKIIDKIQHSNLPWHFVSAAHVTKSVYIRSAATRLCARLYDEPYAARAFEYTRDLEEATIVLPRTKLPSSAVRNGVDG